MMDDMDSHFSWSDTVRAAFGSCLSCLPAAKPHGHGATSSSVTSVHDADPTTSNHNHIVRAIRSDELEGLLADSDDAETLSLHSNPGRTNRRRKPTRLPKVITFFGWNLFGKRRQAIQLPDDDEDDGIIRPSRLRSRGLGTSTTSTMSSSTLDSDAPQLSPSVLDNITPEQLRERALAAEAAEAEERRLKEERKQKRREKRELKRVAQALALDRGAGDEDFEGFQGSGSGSGYPGIPSPFQSPSLVDSASEGYGPFVRGAVVPINEDADADEAADLDGGVYTARRAVSGGSSGGSDSRSRTSASRSDTSYPYHHISQPPLPHPHPQLLPPGPNRPKKRSKKTKSSTTSGSQSPSIRSPASATFPTSGFPFTPEVALQASEMRLDGLDESELAEEHRVQQQLPQPSKFPSSGFGGVGRRSSNGGMGGAFLANTS
ncbi:hypothetical protein ONZ45_g12484 [Pleurotus djamor]|nr:hypothetical protein ONZ45_g12484 [Pleurotus djamor]